MKAKVPHTSLVHPNTLGNIIAFLESYAAHNEVEHNIGKLVTAAFNAAHQEELLQRREGHKDPLDNPEAMHQKGHDLHIEGETQDMQHREDYPDSFVQVLWRVISEMNAPGDVTSPVNGFTIEERDDGTYVVNGECWSFTMVKEDGKWTTRE